MLILLVGVPLSIVGTSVFIAKVVVETPSKKGVKAYMKGDYKRSERYLLQALERDANDDTARIYLAATYLNRSRYAEVFKHLEIYEQRRGDDRTVLFYRAQAFFRSGDDALKNGDYETGFRNLEQAIEVCERYVNYDPDDLEFHDLLARIGTTQLDNLRKGTRMMISEAISQGEVRKIMRAFNEAVYEPSVDTAKQAFRQFLIQEYPAFPGKSELERNLLLSRTEFNRAMVHYARTVEIDKNYTSAARYLAHLHLASENYEEAEKQCVYLVEECNEEENDTSFLSAKTRAIDINLAHKYRYFAHLKKAGDSSARGEMTREDLLRLAAQSGEKFLEGPKSKEDWNEVLLQLAEIYLELDDKERYQEAAAAIYDRIGESSQGLLYDGIASQFIEKYRRAAENLDQAFLRIPNHPYGRLAMARSQMALENPQRAVQEYKKAILADPELLDARKELIEVYVSLGNAWIFDAVDEAEALLARDHQHRETRELHRKVERLALNPSANPIETLDQANNILRQNPGNAYARLRRAELLLESGEAKDAMAEAKTLMEMQRDLYPARLVLGYGYLFLGSHKQARSQFRIATLLNKHRVEARLGLVRTYIAERRFQPARKEIQNTLRSIAPDSQEFKLELARLYLQLGDGDKLAKTLTTIEQPSPEYIPEIQFLRGRFNLLLENIDEAERFLSEI